jgi:hypothetical protein
MPNSARQLARIHVYFGSLEDDIDAQEFIPIGIDLRRGANIHDFYILEIVAQRIFHDALDFRIVVAGHGSFVSYRKKLCLSRRVDKAVNFFADFGRI